MRPHWNRFEIEIQYFLHFVSKLRMCPYYSSSMNHRMTWFSQVFFGGTTTYFSVLTNTRVLNCTRTWIMTCLSALFSHLLRTGSPRLTMLWLYMIQIRILTFYFARLHKITLWSLNNHILTKKVDQMRVKMIKQKQTYMSNRIFIF